MDKTGDTQSWLEVACFYAFKYRKTFVFCFVGHSETGKVVTILIVTLYETVNHAIMNVNAENRGKDIYVVSEYTFGFECRKDIELSHEHTGCVWLTYEEIYIN